MPIWRFYSGPIFCVCASGICNIYHWITFCSFLKHIVCKQLPYPHRGVNNLSNFTIPNLKFEFNSTWFLYNIIFLKPFWFEQEFNWKIFQKKNWRRSLLSLRTSLLNSLIYQLVLTSLALELAITKVVNGYFLKDVSS